MGMVMSMNSVMNQITSQSLIENLVAYYRLNGDALDYSGNGHNADVVQNITYGTGVVGQSAVWDGSNTSKIETEGQPFTFTDGVDDLPFSISFWVYHNSAGNAWYVTKRDFNDTGEFQAYNYQNKLKLFLLSNDNSKYIGAGANFTPNINQWYHYTFTYSGNKQTSGINVYIDGVKQTIDTTNNSGSYEGIIATNSKLTFGNPKWSTLLNLNGKMQMIAMFDKELSEAEVLNYFNYQQTNFLR